MEIILKDESYFEVDQADIIYWAGIYTRIDPYHELMKMGAWCLANPAKRKTKAGIKRFMNSWLSRADEKGCSIAIPLQESLVDVTWVTDPVLRLETQEYFVEKYGFYVLNGQRVEGMATHEQKLIQSSL